MTAGSPCDDELARLRAENADLRERLAAFERDVLGDVLVFPADWALTPKVARLLAVLLSRPCVSRDAAIIAMGRFAGEPITRIVDVQICRLRRAVAPHGITIRTVPGEGYVIDEPARSQWRERLLPRQEPGAARMAA